MYGSPRPTSFVNPLVDGIKVLLFNRQFANFRWISYVVNVETFTIDIYDFYQNNNHETDTSVGVYGTLISKFATDLKNNANPMIQEKPKWIYEHKYLNDMKISIEQSGIYALLIMLYLNTGGNVNKIEKFLRRAKNDLSFFRNLFGLFMFGCMQRNDDDDDDDDDATDYEDDDDMSTDS
jgi:hypothetical protein